MADQQVEQKAKRAPDTFRKEYGTLTDEQKAEMVDIKNKAEELETLFLKSQHREYRLMAVALTQLEITIAMAVKAVTTPQR